MRTRTTLVFVLLSLLSPGCALIKDGCHQMRSEFCDCVEQTVERHRNRKWAESAWRDFCGNHPRKEFSEDYAQGFKDGFADYLYSGGDTEPPPLPPLQYRKYRYQTPAGYRAIEDWFAGYRYGTAVARDGNYRGFITGPSSQAHLASAPGEEARHPAESENNLAKMENQPGWEPIKIPTRLEESSQQPPNPEPAPKILPVENTSLPKPPPSWIDVENTGAAERTGNSGVPTKPNFVQPITVKILDVTEGSAPPMQQRKEQPIPAKELVLPATEKREPGADLSLGIELQSATEQPAQTPVPAKVSPDAKEPGPSTKQPDFYVPRR